MPSGYLTDMCMSWPSWCMWGETARACRSTGTYQLALTSTLLLPAGRRKVEFVALFQCRACLTGLREKYRPNARPVVAGLADGVVVDLEDDVGLGGDVDADAVGQAMGLAAGGPEAQFIGLDPGPGGVG